MQSRGESNGGHGEWEVGGEVAEFADEVYNRRIATENLHATNKGIIVKTESAKENTRTLIGRIVLGILASFLMYCVWIFCAIMSALSIRITWEFYEWVVTIGCAVLWLFLLLCIWRKIKFKAALICPAIVIAAIVLPLIAFKMNDTYLRSIEVKNDINKSLYEPFRMDTRAASLDEYSTLTLTNNLPRLDGALALYPLYSAFAKAVYPANDDTTLPWWNSDTITCQNTPYAYEKLIKGDVDIIFVAGPSAEQLQMAKAVGVEFKLTPIGREAFVFFVNAKNPVNGLSTKEIQNIYSGESTNWSEFGGKDSAIRAFQRPVNSGSQTALIRLWTKRLSWRRLKKTLQTAWAAYSARLRRIRITIIQSDIHFYFLRPRWFATVKSSCLQLMELSRRVRMSRTKPIRSPPNSTL